jgi:DNA transposition AAA+ family ATPase
MDHGDDNSAGENQQPLAAKVRDAIAARGLSQAEAARQADMSGGALSSFLAGRYKGDNEELARKLSAWLGSLSSGDGLTATFEAIKAYAETPTSMRIKDVLEFAKAMGLIASIAGTSGIGKTRTLKHFAETSTAVWYCEFSEDTTSVYATLAEVADAVGITKLPLRPDELRREIVARIKRTKGLLLCDEAQHLTPKGFEQIRTLHDRTGIGIVFAGHLDLSDKIARLPQLDGRVSAPLRIGAAKPADADALFASWGFDCKQSRDFLRPFARQATGLRKIANAYRLAATYAAGAGAPVAFEHIRQAWAALAGATDHQ